MTGVRDATRAEVWHQLGRNACFVGLTLCQIPLRLAIPTQGSEHVAVRGVDPIVVRLVVALLQLLFVDKAAVVVIDYPLTNLIPSISLSA